MKEKFQLWWLSLALREKKLLVLAIAMFFFSLCWFGFWQPLNQKIEQYRKQIVYQQETLSWMQQKAGELKALQQNKQTKTVVKESLESIIYQSARQYRVIVKGINPQSKQFAVDIDTTGFNELLEWLFFLRQQYGIYTVSIELSADENRQNKVQVRKLVLRGDQYD